MSISQVMQTIAAVGCLLVAGCASERPPKPNAKGHWETLPPVTGSMIQRRVWVDENGNISNPLDAQAGAVGGGSKADLEKVQRTSGSMRRIGE